MDINCPYCGTHYELNEALIPDGDIKVRCRVCSNVFTLNKKNGVVKDSTVVFSSSADEKTDKMFANDSSVKSASNNTAPEKDDAQTTNSNSKNLSEMPEDFMKSIISEINSAVAEESSKTDAVKDVGGGKKRSSEKKGASPFQISMLILLGIVFLIAVFSLLVHYGVINAGFLPPAVSELLSSF